MDTMFWINETVIVSPARRTPKGPGTTDGAWVWTITERNSDGTMITTEYRTNKAGNGLWVCGESTASDKQIAGTCDFSLNCSPTTRRARVLMTSDTIASRVEDARDSYDPVSAAQAYAAIKNERI